MQVSVQPKAAKKSEQKVKKSATANLPAKSSDHIKINREELDDVIRKALRSGYGRAVPILGVLGQRFTAPSKKSGFPFYRVLADAGKDGLVTVFVSGFYSGGPGPTASISPAVKSSYTVKMLLARLARKTKRAAESVEGDRA
jgi:hypothetical protein